MIRSTSQSFGRRGISLAVTIVMSAHALGCGRVLPPPAAPPAGNPPSVDLPDTQAGESAVVVDANEPSRVSVVLAHTEAVAYGSRGGSAMIHGTQTQQICARTPCAVAMPQGQIELAFQSLSNDEARSSDTVDVKKRPIVFRHQLGEVSTHPLPYLGGWVLASTGLVLGGVGALITSTTSYDYATGKEVPTTFLGMNQTTTLALGGLLVAGGIALAYLFQPSVRPGSSTAFDLAPSTRADLR